MRSPTDPHFWGHRERLKKRFQQTQLQGFQDYEILELLLTYAIPRRDVKPLAKDLIATFGSLSGVLEADPASLKKVKRLGAHSALLIQLVKEMGTVYQAEKMKANAEALSPSQLVLKFAQSKIGGSSNEAFLVIYLNQKNKVLHSEVLSEGTVNRVTIYPRRILEKALEHHVSGIILVHNHPSGSVSPSEEDKELTQTLIQLNKAMDIRVLDHIIVGPGGYFSFSEEGLI